MANRNTQGFGLVAAGTLGDQLQQLLVRVNTKSTLVMQQLYITAKRLLLVLVT